MTCISKLKHLCSHVQIYISVGIEPYSTEERPLASDNGHPRPCGAACMAGYLSAGAVLNNSVSTVPAKSN